MMLLGLLLVPLIGSLLVSLTTGLLIRVVHMMTALLTLALAVGVAASVARTPAIVALDGLLRVDALSAWMAVLIGLVGCLGAVEAPRYVASDAPGRFYRPFHLLIFTMLLAVTTDDVGLMWVAVEGTTLSSVFLVNFERTRQSLEAAYKYLLVCSVGIAIAFLGTVLVYFSDVQQFGHLEHALRWTTLMRLAPGLPPRVIEMAFVFLLVGYGTKAGLAPMHTWLPDAHSEAPAPVSALMSGVLLGVGIYAVLRFKPIVDLAAGPLFAQRLLLALGLASMAVAAAFLWASRNYKRMLAYSSVEHIGLVCLGVGFGGPWGIAGALLHLANHALAKSLLFLMAGRIRAAYGSAEITSVRGLLSKMPTTGKTFFTAMLALLGLPPFGLFISEIMIFGAGLGQGHLVVSWLALTFLVIGVGGLLRALHRMCSGAPNGQSTREGSAWVSALPVAAAVLLLVLSGLAGPSILSALLERIATVVGV